jgi:hypothetical protein
MSSRYVDCDDYDSWNQYHLNLTTFHRPSTSLNSSVVNMNSSNLLVVLALVIRLATRRRHIVLPASLETEQLVHLVDTQTLGVVNEEPSIDTGADQACCEEDVHAPAHAGVHLRQCLGDDQGPDPHTCGCERTGHGAECSGEDLSRDDPGQAVSPERL